MKIDNIFEFFNNIGYTITFDNDKSLMMIDKETNKTMYLSDKSLVLNKPISAVIPGDTEIVFELKRPIVNGTEAENVIISAIKILKIKNGETYKSDICKYYTGSNPFVLINSSEGNNCEFSDANDNTSVYMYSDGVLVYEKNEDSIEVNEESFNEEDCNKIKDIVNGSNFIESITSYYSNIFIQTKDVVKKINGNEISRRKN